MKKKSRQNKENQQKKQQNPRTKTSISITVGTCRKTKKGGNDT